MKIYFVRHGKTQANHEGRILGYNYDSPLLDESIEELKALGKYLSDIKFDKLFSSDMGCAHASAQLINSENHSPQTVITNESLREWDFGSLEGQKNALVDAIYPTQFKALKSNLAQFDNNSFDAESVYRATKRIVDFVNHLKDEKAENILIVGHGAILTAGIRTLLGYEVGHLRAMGKLECGSLTVLETKDFEHFDLETWNSQAYLEEAEMKEHSVLAQA